MNSWLNERYLGQPRVLRFAPVGAPSILKTWGFSERWRVSASEDAPPSPQPSPAQAGEGVFPRTAFQITNPAGSICRETGARICAARHRDVGLRACRSAIFEEVVPGLCPLRRRYRMLGNLKYHFRILNGFLVRGDFREGIISV